MPAILLAGIVTFVRSVPFPLDEERPHCVVEVRVPESVTPWRVLAFDDQIPEAEILTRGDHVAIQGKLQITARPGPNGQRIVSITVVASQVLPLRRRSVNRLPVAREQEQQAGGN
jgi:hypothetical protein